MKKRTAGADMAAASLTQSSAFAAPHNLLREYKKMIQSYFRRKIGNVFNLVVNFYKGVFGAAFDSQYIKPHY
ncbi:MAG: hypothetical protein SOZ34_08355 [Clostridia bacterium]|nr:hypothetical protein [Clostridia bacterium]